MHVVVRNLLKFSDLPSIAPPALAFCACHRTRRLHGKRLVVFHRARGDKRLRGENRVVRHGHDARQKRKLRLFGKRTRLLHKRRSYPQTPFIVIRPRIVHLDERALERETRNFAHAVIEYASLEGATLRIGCRQYLPVARDDLRLQKRGLAHGVETVAVVPRDLDGDDVPPRFQLFTKRQFLNAGESMSGSRRPVAEKLAVQEHAAHRRAREAQDSALCRRAVELRREPDLAVPLLLAPFRPHGLGRRETRRGHIRTRHGRPLPAHRLVLFSGLGLHDTAHCYQREKKSYCPTSPAIYGRLCKFNHSRHPRLARCSLLRTHSQFHSFS